MIVELELKVAKVGLIVNRAPDGLLDPGIQEEIKAQNLTLIGVLPQDDLVYQYDAAGKPLISLPDDSKIKLGLAEIIKKLDL